MSPDLQQLADALIADARLQQVWETLHAQQHTGPVTFHFAQGVPNAVELPCSPLRIKLDKRERQA